MPINSRAFVTDVELVQFWPAAADIDPDVRSSYLELTQCDFNACVWGCKLWRGHLALTIHNLKMWSQSQGSGTTPTPTGSITSLTQGPYSASFAVATPGDSGDEWLSSTPEGKQYLALRKSLGPVPRPLRAARSCRGGRFGVC